ncbi:MAG: ATP phosphoribosyltransferase regulatory subunit, partial [Clostridia bacterium]|nr:ATP phosphoribosyltransferase regulatory subunit [Clostridia bacterium]
ADVKKALAALQKLPEDTQTFVCEMQNLLKLVPTENINIDFSAGGDERYYNGLVFKGYISGVPSAVLYGGRYDRLVSRLGKSAKAAGFALYLGELAQYFDDEPTVPDILLVYKKDGAAKALALAEKLRGEGKRVLITCEKPCGFDGKIVYAEE